MWATLWPSRCTLTHPLNGVKKALNPDKQGIYIRYIVKNDSRDNLRSFNESIIALANANITKRDYEIALRFCDFKFRRGKCDRSITQAEKDFLLSGKNIEVNCLEILKAVIVSFRNYWEDVLISYKKASARKNRLNYLVDKLGEVKDWPEICNDIDAVKEISDLQAFYSEQANQM